MKITESQLRNIVRQELITVLSEDQQQLDEGLGKTLSGLALAAMIALGGYKGVQINQQQAKEQAEKIENLRQDVTKLSLDQKVKLIGFHAGAQAIKSGHQPEEIKKIEQDAINSVMTNGQPSEKLVNLELQHAIGVNPKVVNEFVMGLKEIK